MSPPVDYGPPADSGSFEMQPVHPAMQTPEIHIPEVDPREPAIDRPLSTLFALYTAARRPDFPTWAEGSLRRALDGDLEEDLGEAIAVARALCDPLA